MTPLVFSASCVLVQFAEPLWCCRSRRWGLAGRGCEALWVDSPFSTWRRDAKTSSSCTGGKEKTHTSRAMSALLHICCCKGDCLSSSPGPRGSSWLSAKTITATRHPILHVWFFFLIFFKIWNKSQCCCHHSVLLELFSMAPVLLLSKPWTFGCSSNSVWDQLSNQHRGVG